MPYKFFVVRSTATLVVSLLFAIVTFGVLVAHEATLTSDRDDYLPGETAVLTGTGFEPGELVDLSISIEDLVSGEHVGDYAFTQINADQQGGFVVDYLVPQEASDKQIIAVALGMTSGRAATATFWDGNIGVHNVNFAATGLPSATSVAVSGNAPTPGSTHTASAYSTSFSTPSASSNIGAAPSNYTSGGHTHGSLTFTFNFPTTKTVGSVVYNLTGASVTAGSSSVTSFTFSATTGAGSFVTGAPNTGSGGVATRVTATYALANNPPVITASNVNLGAVCTSDGNYTTTVTPSTFGTASDPDAGDSVTFTFSDNTTSKVVTLSAGVPSQSFTLKAVDSHGALATPVTVSLSADVHTQPVNAAPVITATDYLAGEICSVGDSMTVTVTPEMFGSATDSDCDPVTLTFLGGSTSQTVTLTSASPEAFLTLVAVDDPSGRDNEHCAPMSPLSAEPVEVMVSVHLVAVPTNSAPTVTASDYAVPGTYYVTDTDCSVTIPVTAAMLGAGFSDADGDPISAAGFILDPTSVVLNAALSSALVSVTAFDNPFPRYLVEDPDMHCVDLWPVSGMGSASANVSANFEVMVNTAPTITVGTETLDLGSIALNGTTTYNASFAVGDFSPSASDSDVNNGISDLLGSISLNTTTLTFEFPSGSTNGDEIVTLPVVLSVTDDPSPRNALINVPGCDPLAPMTGTKTVYVRVHLYRNRAPEFSAFSNKDLGNIIGCMENGQFQETVNLPTTDGDLRSYFSLTTADPDGDPITVSADVTQVTLIGPGLAQATVHLTATDDPTARHSGLLARSTTIEVLVTARVTYDFVGFFSPLSNTKATLVKRGSAVPVKFQLRDCDGNVVSTGLHSIRVLYQSGVSPSGDPIVDDSGASNDNGVYFRFSGAPGMQWIYNLKTDSTYKLGATYVVRATLDDGTTHDVLISIKP